MRILVTGKDGLLAPYFKIFLPKSWDVQLTGRRDGELKCDLSIQKDVKKLLNKFNPDVIIHCAALTNVDLAEENKRLAYKLNCKLVENISKFIKDDTLLIYFSTDQVYSGYKHYNALYSEDATKPINVYGKTKLQGEKIVKKHKKNLIFRSNFFGKSYSKNRNSFDEFIINTVKSKKKLYLFDDIKFTPLLMKTVVKITKLSIQNNITGIYNLGSRSGMTKYQFGKNLLNKLNLNYNNIIITKSKEIKNRAIRPMNMQLNSKKIEKKLNIKMPRLIDEINNYVR